MKTLTCQYCDYDAKGNTEQEVMDDMDRHMKQTHPAEHEEWMKMPKADQDKMMNESRMKIKDMA